MTHVLAIDQGTTSTRAILFGPDLAPGASAREEFTQHYPRPGWVEHDPADIWETTLRTCRAAMAAGRAEAWSRGVRMMADVGPMKAIPSRLQASTKSGFSDRSP